MCLECGKLVNCDFKDTSTIRTPERHEHREKVATEIIEKLDISFSRVDVRKVAEWVKYLSTQD